jgi:hypothetical protein
MILEIIFVIIIRFFVILINVSEKLTIKKYFTQLIKQHRR